MKKHPVIQRPLRTAGFLCIAALLLASCSTTVHQEVERPANLEVENYNAVSALPFRTSTEMGTASYDSTPVYSFDEYTRRQGEIYSSQNEEKALLAKLDEQLSRRLLLADNLNYVDPKDVEYALRQRSAKIPADLYITGGLVEFSSTIEKESEDTGETDKEGKPVLKTNYWREVSATLLYQVVETSTNRVISKEKYSCEGQSSKTSNWKQVESSYSILSSKLDSFITRIMQDFTPYTESKSLTLLKAKGSDMKEANKLAHNGKLVPARNKFLSIYRSEHLFEAGYNAALLYEAMELYDEALALMQDVWQSSGDSRAKEKIRDLQKERQAAQRLQLQKSSSSTSSSSSWTSW
ncbi:MAG: hypothetical protein K6G18_16745 [Treponema sp.]|nr:hypothetical protein [Treponema sp.]